MKSFLQYLKESMPEAHPLEAHPVLFNFLHHLSSHTYPHKKGDKKDPATGVNELEFPTGNFLDEANSIDHIRAAGQAGLQAGNPLQAMKAGFHAAFPEGEDPKVTKKKAQIAQKHFRQFMHERGGHSASNASSLTNSNGKTQLSSGEGVKTIGIGMAPHTTSGYKHDICPRASAECRKNCLGLTAGGNKQYPEAALRAKILRTHYVHEHPEHAARLLSHEISHNEKAAAKIQHKSGVRLNMTSDIPYEHLMPKSFFDRHANTQFYDYTKIAGRLNSKHLPPNYKLSLSHTGTDHPESNDAEAIKALNAGHVVSMVHHRPVKKGGKLITPMPTHVEDVQTGKRWKIANGDLDDNVYDRHKTAGVPDTEGVVSGLKLKGVKNEAAGKFANAVDPDGVIRINKNPKQKPANPFPIMK